MTQQKTKLLPKKQPFFVPEINCKQDKDKHITNITFKWGWQSNGTTTVQFPWRWWRNSVKAVNLISLTNVRCARLLCKTCSVLMKGASLNSCPFQVTYITLTLDKHTGTFCHAIFSLAAHIFNMPHIILFSRPSVGDDHPVVSEEGRAGVQVCQRWNHLFLA